MTKKQTDSIDRKDFSCKELEEKKGFFTNEAFRTYLYLNVYSKYDTLEGMENHKTHMKATVNSYICRCGL